MIRTRGQGSVDSAGNVTIRFNDCNGESIVSTDNRYKLLPCNTCDSVYWVYLYVVSFCCDQCSERL